MLLETGIQVNTTNSNNTSVVMRAMPHLEAAVRTVLEYGTDLSMRNTDGDTVITMISEDTSIGSIKRVRRSGAQLDVVGNAGWSPLMMGEAVEKCDMLSGTQRNQPVGLPYLPSSAAYLRGSRDLVRLLTENHNVSEDTADPLGIRPVRLSFFNYVEVLEQLNPPEADFAAYTINLMPASAWTALIEIVLELSIRQEV